MKVQNLILILAIGAIITGCQASVSVDTPNNENTQAVDHGMPLSNGPTGEPSVKGPTSPPPGADDGVETKATGDLSPQAEAVTTNENIRLTLPLKTDEAAQ